MLAHTYITYVAVAALALVSMTSAAPVTPAPVIPGFLPGTEQYFVACCVQNVAACCVKNQSIMVQYWLRGVSLYLLGLLTPRVHILYAPTLPLPHYYKNHRKHPHKSHHTNDLLHRTVAKLPQTPINNVHRSAHRRPAHSPHKPSFLGTLAKMTSMGVKIDRSNSRPNTALAS
ncbi:hypothetical protein BGZ59_001341 [Podila verticillata]|nr:hypothetical protein BGZ59_001341 [Podila verticillata]